MNTSTLDDAIEAAKHTPLVEEANRIKAQYFAGPLTQLHDLERQWSKQLPAFQTRLSNALNRINAAQAVVSPRLVYQLVGRLLQDLQGTGPFPGLLASIGQQIKQGIASMEGFGPSHLHDRLIWISWPNIPARVRDNIASVDALLLRLEAIVQDGGELQALIESGAAQNTAASSAG